MGKNRKNSEKMQEKNSKKDAHHTITYLYILATPQYGYVVCCSVPKSTTIPIPALPILETPWAFPYPC
jgi:hypothetical protein